MKQLKALSAAIALSVFAPLAMAAGEDYPINFPLDATIDSNGGRFINSIILTSPTDGSQTAPVNQSQDWLLYHDVTNLCFAAVPGETVIPSFDWMGGWMHGYVYLDCGNDGNFDVTLDEAGNIVDAPDVMAYSNYNRFNSAGVQTDNGNVGVFPPSFVMPDLEPGIYRMRYKVDWNSIDPGGNDENGAIHKQTIVRNKGGIADVLVYLHNAESSVEVVSPHGKVLNSAGEEIAQAGLTPGEMLTVDIVPDEGYSVTGITVESGYDVELPEGVEFALSSLNRVSHIIPSYLIVDNEADIPAAYTLGNVKIIVAYTLDNTVDYDADVTGTKDTGEGITAVSIASGDQGSTVSGASFEVADRHYYAADNMLHAFNNSVITPAFTYGTGDATTVNFYVDFNQDGQFSEEMGEKLASCSSDGTMEAFEMPAGLANAVYRARFEAEGVNVIDFPLNIHGTDCLVNMDVKHGYALGQDGAAVPATFKYGVEGLTITPVPTLPGFTAESLTVRHGHNLHRRQYIRGNCQWEEFSVPVGETTVIPADLLHGDVLITGSFEPGDDCEWQPVWADEFDGNKLDTQNWSYHPRYSSAWNRFIAVGAECEVVNVIEDGQYKSYCMPTPEEFKSTEKQPMISGAIYTSGKFYCTGGWIEARLKTTRHTGNFPAFWMMPTTAKTWPLAGEIDIFETINNENRAWHTIHTAWANQNGDHSLGRPDEPSPTKGGSEPCTVEDWHVYALEWDQDALKWYVDGDLKFTYPNMHYSDDIYDEFLAWPFSKPFYIICNQSVGNGSWAAQPDTQFTYHTEFDYVRVYQKKDQLYYYSTADGLVAGVDDVVVAAPVADPNAPVEIFTLQGIRVSEDNLAPGFYIRRQGNKTEKFVVR